MTREIQHVAMGDGDGSISSLAAGTRSRFQLKRNLLLALTLILSGRAMTLIFIGQAGGAGPGDPPAAWLMPLVGDAVIGTTALLVVLSIWRPWGVFAWTTAIVWNSLGIWDALSAFLIHKTAPWPTFFMIEIFGSSMFFAASGMHVLCIYLLCHKEIRNNFFRLASPSP
ncbi:MAG: hypothetical protein K0U98_04535 [Deltaproteobacteria bacterium]|nr:hypothetical protein [Deltaproteobacteria bacterium]